MPRRFFTVDRNREGSAMQEKTGGCPCVRVRYRADVEPAEAYACHCAMCRNATGGAWTAFINVAPDNVTWEGEPDWYQSSAIARRPFCSTCGTPLGFAFLEGGNLDLTIGSFDDPAPFRPVHNYASESILAAWLNLEHLPGKRSDENENVVRRWHAAGLEVPQ
jgi:hypothetical protein